MIGDTIVYFPNTPYLCITSPTLTLENPFPILLLIGMGKCGKLGP